MMRLKLQKGVLLAFAMIAVIFLYSCVEEPTIAPAATPYSSVRVANLTANIASMSVTIDGETNLTLAQGQVSNRFDLTSGSRVYKLTDADGNVIYENPIGHTSFEETTITFAGYYSPVDTLNTFAFFSIIEGDVTVLEAPPGDSAWVNFVNLVTDGPTLGAEPIAYALITADNDSVAQNVAGFELSDNQAYQVASGQYALHLFNTDTANVDMRIETTVSITAGTRNYIYVYGLPDDFDVLKDEQNPLPVRKKDELN